MEEFLYSDFCGRTEESWVGINSIPISMLMTNPASFLLMKMAWAFYACFIILVAVNVSCKHSCEGSAVWQVLSNVQVHSLVDFVRICWAS